MDLKKLHEKYKDADSPSVETQIKWLRKLGFQNHIIDQTMISCYTDIEQGIVDFKNGIELNRFIRDTANKILKDELENYVKHLEQFEKKIRDKWLKTPAEQPSPSPWWKRIFGK